MLRTLAAWAEAPSSKSESNKPRTPQSYRITAPPPNSICRSIRVLAFSREAFFAIRMLLCGQKSSVPSSVPDRASVESTRVTLRHRRTMSLAGEVHRSLPGGALQIGQEVPLRSLSTEGGAARRAREVSRSMPSPAAERLPRPSKRASLLTEPRRLRSGTQALPGLRTDYGLNQCESLPDRSARPLPTVECQVRDFLPVVLRQIPRKVATKLLQPLGFQFGLDIFKILAREGFTSGHSETELVNWSSLPIRYSEVAVIHAEILAEIRIVVRCDIQPGAGTIRAFPIPRRFPCRADVLRSGALQDLPRSGSPLRIVALDGKQNMAVLNSALILFGHILRSPRADQSAG